MLLKCTNRLFFFGGAIKCLFECYSFYPRIDLTGSNLLLFCWPPLLCHLQRANGIHPSEICNIWWQWRENGNSLFNVFVECSTNIQTNKQTNKQINRQTEREREKNIMFCSMCDTPKTLKKFISRHKKNIQAKLKLIEM
jgi:hypothetical protein